MKKRTYALRRKRRYAVRRRFIIIVGALAVALAAGIFFIVKATNSEPGIAEPPSELATLTAPDIANLPSDETTEQPEPVPIESPSLTQDLIPSKIDETDPANFEFETHIYVDNVEQDTYTRPEPISFGSGTDYNTLEGVTTYRGNNYRDTASAFDVADITDETLTLLDIDKTTGSIDRWRGSVCTGQPLIVTWPDKTRQNMTTLYNQFKNKQGFTEVIIASADGCIYFMELSTGEKTRDPIEIGAPTKGTPSLDPRGYPIIYVGQGLNPEGSIQKSNDMYFRVYNLIDGKLLHEFGAVDKDPTAYRDNWQAYDASPLIVDDTLIEPGENGVLYTLKLNTEYDEETGKVSMNPDPMVKYTYDSKRNEQTGIYGMENSPVGWQNYVFFTDNIGMLQCVDLNTMTLVYANDLENDSDVSMVLEEDTKNLGVYLYTGCEYDDSVVDASSTTGKCYARKLDALTGEILWTRSFTVLTEIVDGKVDNGILASPILGKQGTTIEGLIIYTVSGMMMEDGSQTAKVIALNKDNGDIVWQVDMENSGWTPSSAAAVYTEDGQGYIVQCLYKGGVKLIRAAKDTASVMDSINVSEEIGTDEKNNFEATPAVYGDTIVVGSKSGHFFFLRMD